MTADREQTRRDAGYETLLRTVAASIENSDPDAAQALRRAGSDVEGFIAELEQAERERDEAWRTYHEEREKLVARLAKVPALVEALRHIANYTFDVNVDAEDDLLAVKERASAAVAAFEEPGVPS